jgi:ribosomal protein S18 acetylase RimI-like enzyme
MRPRGLPGIMLETQNNNIGACKFYERCGFQLGEFDKFLYKGLEEEMTETAMYWYLLLDDMPANPSSASLPRARLSRVH